MYQAFYNLRGKPFQLTPDAAMLFPSKGHKRAMAYLLYGLEQGEGFVMITGPVGTGKTLLIQRLLEEVAHRQIAMASIASANLGSEDILPAVASAFDLPYERRSKEALLQDLKRHLKTLRERHAHALLVVDEAQTLTPSALEMLRILSNMECDGRALLQVFLVGQSELRGLIINNRMEQLRQRVIVSHRLEPLGEEESRAYILHRLQAVGWDHDPDFTPGIFSTVYEASRGIPRRINLIMDRLLLHGYLEELHELDDVAVATVLEEIRDEMPEMPATLEASETPYAPGATQNPAASAQEAQYTKLEMNANKVLLRLMRETIRLRKTIHQRSVASVTEDDDTEGRDRTGGDMPEDGDK
ncbi:AAA family ATPase [Oleiagrimonas sp. C23AA]|uniref:ExeA family protein n=1 Tax=Oleiagrimonas sp. C23AA TaxID=2719047 RepID=UPI001422AC6C|nr:AAA family ATPase [Oleiagrimonas sp. C23AA]NII11172.1 AAA family ATPase [Oleiagrimonas sp. C23AA]